jgi:hypothetical protein
MICETMQPPDSRKACLRAPSVPNGLRSENPTI